MVADRHASLFQNEQIPATVDWLAPDEWGLYHATNQTQIDALNELYRDRLRALMAVDEMLGAIIAEVRARGELASTYWIITSDNGYLLGHRRHQGKQIPYDRALRVPFWISGPGVIPGETDRLITLADLAPTITDYATGFQPGYMDGTSLRPVVEDPLLDPAQWRHTVVAEGADWLTVGPGLTNAHNSHWTAAITETEKYVEFSDGRWMYHDLSSDPLEMVPSADSLTDRSDWHIRLALIEQCVARGCRSEEPETAIGTPRASIRPATGGFVIDGFAAARTGERVSEVRLVIRNVASSEYWNGATWQPGWVQVAAAPDDPGAPFSAWSYFLNVNVSEGTQIIVWARGYDSGGGWDRLLPSVWLTLRDGYADRPDTTLVLPRSLGVGSVTIGGWVVDRSGVDRLELTVDGNAVAATLGPPPRRELIRTWTAEIVLSSGTHVIRAAAVDVQGLVDLTPATQTVVIP